MAGIARWGNGKLPARWISRHENMGRAWGNIDKLGNGRLYVVNKVPYASDYKKVLSYHLKNRRRLAEKRMDNVMRALVRKENQRRSA